MQKSKRRSALVTGGAGFLGSHLCERLLEQRMHVTCLDNLFTGSTANIEHLLEHPQFDFVEHDVRNPFHIDARFIYNLACPASPVHYQFDPVYTLTTSVMGMINILELAKRTKARVLHASTSEVYGDPDVHPQAESYWGSVNPIGPRACYDEGKRCAETLMVDYHRQYGIVMKVARIFNTYGPRMSPDDGRVVSNFIVQALRGEPITLYGSGEQTRSFCYVDDLIDALLTFMNTPDGFTGPVNLGNPTEFKVRELARHVLRLTDSKSKMKHAPLPADDPKQRRPDITLARSALGWDPRVPLDAGLETTIAYFRKVLGPDVKAPVPLLRQRQPAPARAATG